MPMFEIRRGSRKTVVVAKDRSEAKSKAMKAWGVPVSSKALSVHIKQYKPGRG